MSVRCSPHLPEEGSLWSPWDHLQTGLRAVSMALGAAAEDDLFFSSCMVVVCGQRLGGLINLPHIRSGAGSPLLPTPHHAGWELDEARQSPCSLAQTMGETRQVTHSRAIPFSNDEGGELRGGGESSIRSFPPLPPGKGRGAEYPTRQQWSIGRLGISVLPPPPRFLNWGQTLPFCLK